MKILTISPNKISDEKKNKNIKKENQYYFWKIDIYNSLFV